MLSVTRAESAERRYVATINEIHDIVRKLEASLKYSRDLEAARFLRYSTVKSRNQVLTNDLRRTKTCNQQMLNLFRQSVTDIQLDSIDILPETLKRRVQRTWHQKYDALLSQNERLRKQVITMERMMKERQKQIDVLQQRLLDLAGSIAYPEGSAEKICKKCWILRNEI